MEQKNILVAYYSRTGNTRVVAKKIAQQTNGDLDEIYDTKKRKGPKGFVIGAKDARLKRLTEITTQRAPSKYDLVYIGTPVWAGTMTPAVRTYLTQNCKCLPKVAFFLTTRVTGKEKTFEDMSDICGQEPAGTLAVTEKELKHTDWLQSVQEFVSRTT